MKLASSKGGIWLLSNGLQSYFTLKEHNVSCPCCGMGELDERLIDKLQQLSIAARSRFVITSATRCPDYNKKIGGSNKSLHLPITLAADIQDINTPIDKLFFHAAYIFNRVGLYKGKWGAYLHVDLAPKKAYWYKGDKYNYFTSAKECFQKGMKRLYKIEV